MLYGAMVTFMGWTLYGLVSPRFELKNKHKVSCRFYIFFVGERAGRWTADHDLRVFSTSLTISTASFSIC